MHDGVDKKLQVEGDQTRLRSRLHARTLIVMVCLVVCVPAFFLIQSRPWENQLDTINRLIDDSGRYFPDQKRTVPVYQSLDEIEDIYIRWPSWPRRINLKVLRGLRNLKSLRSRPRFTGFQHLAELSALVDLELSGEDISDLSPLAGLARLQRLTLDGTKVQDLSPLRGLVNLREINLTSTAIHDLRPLSGLFQLCKLFAGSCPNLSDIRPLSQMQSLEKLGLSYCPNVRDIRPLANLSRLRYLDLTGTGVENIGPITSLSALERLELGECTSLRNIDGLEKLTNLRILCISTVSMDPDDLDEDFAVELHRLGFTHSYLDVYERTVAPVNATE